MDAAVAPLQGTTKKQWRDEGWAQQKWELLKYHTVNARAN